ncbi:MAG: tRNA (adenosine(37)-N6)-threonylcarbamoyltransferase complex dimerization subunit type 1 TsaB [Elusimicrobiota bacterium]
MPNAVAIESSGAHLSFAVARRGQIVNSALFDAQWRHEKIFWRRFPRLLENSKIKLKDMDFFATTRGPGRFTGIRLSLTIVNTWSWLLKKPVFAPTTLELMAWQARQEKGQLIALTAFSGAVVASQTNRQGILCEPKTFVNLEAFFKKASSSVKKARLIYYAQPNLKEEIKRQALQAGFADAKAVVPSARQLLSFAQVRPKDQKLWRRPAKLPAPLYLKQNWPFIS